MVTTTDSTAIARMSSTIAAPKISRASFDCIFPSSFNTWMDIAMLVAVRAVAIKRVSNAPRPYMENTANPTKNGTITPNAPTVKDAAPPLRNSLGVISNPATNKITMADSSPMCLMVSSNTTSGPPSNSGSPPKA
jgi:hypothetical protein